MTPIPTPLRPVAPERPPTLKQRARGCTRLWGRPRGGRSPIGRGDGDVPDRGEGRSERQGGSGGGNPIAGRGAVGPGGHPIAGGGGVVGPGGRKPHSGGSYGAGGGGGGGECVRKGGGLEGRGFVGVVGFGVTGLWGFVSSAVGLWGFVRFRGFDGVLGFGVTALCWVDGVLCSLWGFVGVPGFCQLWGVEVWGRGVVMG